MSRGTVHQGLKAVITGAALLAAGGLAGCQTARQEPSPPPVTYIPPAQGTPAQGASAQGHPGTASPAPVSQTIRVALLVPLSGPSAATGQALLNAAQLALFDTAGDKFTLVPLDTQGTVEGARLAASSALSQGVQLILGPLFGADVPVVAAMARPAGVPVISFSTDPSVAGQGVYVIGVLLREQARRLVEEAAGRGLNRFAILWPDNAYGQMMSDAWREEISRAGGSLVMSESFPANDTAQTARVVQKIAARLKSQQATAATTATATSAGVLPFDVLLVPESGQKLQELTSLLTYYEIDVRRLKLAGPMLWDDPAIWRDPALEGAWFPAPVPASHQAFASRYQSTWGQPAPAIASLGYDVTALAGALARRSLPGDSTPYSPQALGNPNGFAGVDGLFRFLDNGTSQRGLAVMEIRQGTAMQVGEAPRTFMGQATLPPSPAPSLRNTPGI